MDGQQINLFDVGRGLHVRPVSYQDTIPFIMGIHYARRMPCIQYAFGLFDGVQMIGCVTYGQPASPSLCIGVCGKEYKRNVLELNRLVILPEKNGGNYASMLVGQSLKQLPHGLCIVSYADWGGVAPCRVCVPGNKLALYRNDKSTNRQIQRWA